MAQLILACALFLAIHFFISGTKLRGVIVRRLGEGPYMGLFSLLSLVTLAWIIIAYWQAPYIGLWPSGPVLRHLALLLMLPAVFLVVAGLSTPNPTATGGEKALRQDNPAVGIIRVTRHPFLWGVVLWAVAHLLANGDAASAVLFGSFLILALVGPALIDAKRAKRDPEAWARLAAVTSRAPFLAAAQGRTQLSWAEIGWWRLALSLGVYLLFMAVLHQWLFGVSPLPA